MQDQPKSSQGANRCPPTRDSNPDALPVSPELLELGAMVTPPRAPDAVGRIDRYDILRKLGAGGMGVVLLARDANDDTLVAIKTIRPDYALNERAHRRFIKEATHMRGMEHPHILTVTDVHDGPDGAYYVMPYVPGGSLAGRIDEGRPMPTETVLDIGTQVAMALVYAHDDRGVIHRDIKPDNVLIGDGGVALLSDFGLARTLYNDSLPADHQRRSWTVGTWPQMAPEIARGNAGDGRADLYSLGAMLYEMATGHPPYAGTSEDSVREQILSGPPRPVASLNRACDRGLVTVIEGLMARELRDRYAHAKDVLEDLRRVAAGKTPRGPNGATDRHGSGSAALPVTLNPDASVAEPAPAPPAAPAPIAVEPPPPIRQRKLLPPKSHRPARGRKLAFAVSFLVISGLIVGAALTVGPKVFGKGAPQLRTQADARSVGFLADVKPPSTTPGEPSAIPSAPTTAPTMRPILYEPPLAAPSREELHRALATASADTFARLLTAGLDPNERVTHADIPLIQWAIEKRRDDLALFLLRSGRVTLDARDVRGYTLTHVAAEFDLPAVIKDRAARSPASVNARVANTGDTPLHVAARAGAVGAVRALCELGADPRAPDRAGGAPIDEARRQPPGSIRNEMLNAMTDVRKI